MRENIIKNSFVWFAFQKITRISLHCKLQVQSKTKNTNMVNLAIFSSMPHDGERTSEV